MKYLEMKKRAFMSIVNKVKGFIREVSGTPPLTLPDCVDEDSLVGYTLSGECYQDVTPTPEAPIEVESVGDKTENLMMYPYNATAGIKNGVTFTDNGDGTITVDGTASETANASFGLMQMKNITDKTKKYYLTGCPAGSNASKAILIAFYYEGKYKSEKYETGKGLLLDLSSYDFDFDQINFSIIIAKKQTVDNWVFKPMLVEGDAPKEFEPYNKYKIPVIASGKNYFNLETYTKLIGNGGGDRTSFVTIQDGIIQNQYDIYYEGAYFLTEEPFELSAGTYIISGKVNKWRRNSISVGFRFDNSVTTNIRNSVYLPDYADEWYEFSTKITIAQPMTIIGVYLQDNGATANNFKSTIEFKEIQIEKANSVTDYEPYVEPKTTNIYLDEPLRKIVDYADYIDFEKQKVVRNIGNALLSATALSGSSENNEMLGLYGRVTDKKSINDMYSVQVLSPNLLGVARYYYNTDIPCITAHVTGTVVYFKLPKALLDAETAAAANRYFNANPTTVYYIKDTPTETDIVLPKLPTFKGTTVYSADTKINPSNMSATYYSTYKE